MSQDSHSAVQDALSWANQKGEAVQKQIKEAVSSGNLTLIQSLPGHGARFDTFQALTTEDGRWIHTFRVSSRSDRLRSG